MASAIMLAIVSKRWKSALRSVSFSTFLSMLSVPMTSPLYTIGTHMKATFFSPSRAFVRFRKPFSFEMSGMIFPLPNAATCPVMPSPTRYNPLSISARLRPSEASITRTSPSRRVSVPRNSPISRWRILSTSRNISDTPVLSATRWLILFNTATST